MWQEISGEGELSLTASASLSNKAHLEQSLFSLSILTARSSSLSSLGTLSQETSTIVSPNSPRTPGDKSEEFSTRSLTGILRLKLPTWDPELRINRASQRAGLAPERTTHTTPRMLNRSPDKTRQDDTSCLVLQDDTLNWSPTLEPLDQVLQSPLGQIKKQHILSPEPLSKESMSFFVGGSLNQKERQGKIVPVLWKKGSTPRESLSPPGQQQHPSS